MPDKKSQIDCSFIIPVYFNEGCLKQTMHSIREVIAQNAQWQFEIIFVDDGSRDNSFQELLEIRQENPGLINIIRLTRNFGQPAARLAGLQHARGRCIISMSADGQDPAALCNDMLKAHFEDQVEIVICTRKSREESPYRRITSKLFYELMRKLNFPNMPEGGFDFMLIGRKALTVLLNNPDAQPFIQGQVLWTGFTPRFISYDRLARKVGKSRWTFGKKIALLIDGVMNYSFHPIRIMSLIGVSVSLIGFLIAFYFMMRWFLVGSEVQGWTSLIIIILILSGIQMLMIGIIGEYLWRTLAQTRNRDHFVIDTIIDSDDS